MRFLVPLDLPPTAEQLAALCGELAGMSEATIVLVHVLPRSESIDPMGAARADAYLSVVARAISKTGAEVLHCLRHGDPVEEIVALGRQIEANLIVMHVGQHGPEEPRVRRHVSDDVLERADRPVITIDDHESGGDNGLYAGLALRAATRRARHLGRVAQAA